MNELVNAARQSANVTIEGPKVQNSQNSSTPNDAGSMVTQIATGLLGATTGATSMSGLPLRRRAMASGYGDGQFVINNTYNSYFNNARLNDDIEMANACKSF